LGTVTPHWRIFFDLHGLRQALDVRTKLPLRQLVLNLHNFRIPLASDTRHPLCRAQSERRLQAIIAKDLSRLDVTFQPNHL
jgi:hypothetical protein